MNIYSKLRSNAKKVSIKKIMLKTGFNNVYFSNYSNILVFVLLKAHLDCDFNSSS